MGIGIITEEALGVCVMRLFIEGEFVVDDVAGEVNDGFGDKGNEVFPLPGPALEFPGCTDMGGRSVCELLLLAECTQDDKTCKNSCG